MPPLHLPRPRLLHLLNPRRHASTAAGASPRTLFWKARLALVSAAHALVFTSAGIYLLKSQLLAISGPIDRTPSLPPADSPESVHTLATIAAALATHPLYRALCADPAFHPPAPSWPATLDPAVRARKLTAGTLAGAKRIMASTVFVARDHTRTVSFMSLGTALCGYPNVVHGGVSATVLDEALGRLAALQFADGMRPVTARLVCNYRRPVEAGGTGAGVGSREWGGGEGGVGWLEMLGGLEGKRVRFVVVRCEVAAMEGPRKCRVRGTIEDEAGHVLVQSEGLFVVPRGWSPEKLDTL
ncbi:HotDog domain-containing protein [Geopyxis carbonaria]|nr:HotDog domain-containing protein [Geopyxis carbonaria]